MTTRGFVVKTFGRCCEELRSALVELPGSAFLVGENGVLYLTVGSVETEEGPRFFDQAVQYCPFCGVQLQTKADIQAAAQGSGAE